MIHGLISVALVARTVVVAILQRLAVVPRLERVDPGYGIIAGVVGSEPVIVSASCGEAQMISHVHLMVHHAVVIGHVFFHIQASGGMN